MANRDEWGKDPSVQVMRKVFQAMEHAHQELLKRLDIAPDDQRLRTWREQTLALFERCWGVADQLDVTMDEQTAATIYCSLFAKIMEASGIVIPADIFSPEGNVARLIQAVFP
jgi:hypothetical protein